MLWLNINLSPSEHLKVVWAWSVDEDTWLMWTEVSGEWWALEHASIQHPKQSSNKASRLNPRRPHCFTCQHHYSIEEVQVVQTIEICITYLPKIFFPDCCLSSHGHKHDQCTSEVGRVECLPAFQFLKGYLVLVFSHCVAAVLKDITQTNSGIPMPNLCSDFAWFQKALSFYVQR